MIRGFYILFFIFFSCSSNSADSNPNPPVEIIPSNLTLTVNLVGAGTDNPNGDGSGIIQCTANAVDAISYGYRFGNGTELESISGNYEYIYTNPGINWGR